MQTIRLAVTTAALLLATTANADAQLSLGQAIAEADRAAYANRAAVSIADADRAQATAPLQGILPSARVETGFMRTTDPIGAFGTTLRQRAVTPAAFDPALLNFPAPVNNLQSAFVAEVPLVNLDAWLGRRAASRAADASSTSAEWTRLDTRTNVIRAYYGAVLASEKVAALEVGLRAANAHLAQATSMVEQGMVTRADALLASVRAGEVEADLASARAEALNATRQLALTLGRDIHDLPVLPHEMPASEAIRSIASGLLTSEDDTPGKRADVRAAASRQAAADADRLRARTAALPRLNGFARYDWHHESTPFGGERNWTVGIMATWNLLTSASEIAEIKGAASRSEVARVHAEAIRAQALLEVASARSELEVALQRLTIAERGAVQAAEAHRLVARRYQGELATVAELLEAQATETASALALSHARYGVITSAAAMLQAAGADPGIMTMLDGAER
jgi:outer membrane protein